MISVRIPAWLKISIRQGMVGQ